MSEGPHLAIEELPGVVELMIADEVVRYESPGRRGR
jgi:hypothetical protein